jgi:hypothetical protein
MRAIVFAASAFLLTACAGTPVAAPPACPPVKTYSQADQNALAAAVTALPPDNPLIGVMLDYGRLRAAARVCAKP